VSRSQSYSIHQAQQIPQQGGVWLIKFTLEAHSPSPFSIDSHFKLVGSEANFSLFQQSVTQQGLALQLFSDQPLSETLLNTSSTTNTLVCTHASSLREDALSNDVNTLIIGSDLALANVFYLAKQRAQFKQHTSHTLALLHCTQDFPFKVKPARFMVHDLPPEAIGACPLLEDWTISNRLASDQGHPGCFDGPLEQLLANWLTQKATNEALVPWQIIACMSPEMYQKCQAACKPYPWVTLIGLTSSQLVNESEMQEILGDKPLMENLANGLDDFKKGDYDLV